MSGIQHVAQYIGSKAIQALGNKIRVDGDGSIFLTRSLMILIDRMYRLCQLLIDGYGAIDVDLIVKAIVPKPMLSLIPFGNNTSFTPPGYSKIELEPYYNEEVMTAVFQPAVARKIFRNALAFAILILVQTATSHVTRESIDRALQTNDLFIEMYFPLKSMKPTAAKPKAIQRVDAMFGFGPAHSDNEYDGQF